MKRTALVLFALFALFASSAAAQQGPDPRVLFQEGQAAYSAGDYDLALEKWQYAYELSQRAALLYNIAQAYSRLGRVSDEKAALEAFVEAEGSPPELVSVATERLRSIESRIARTALRIEGAVAGAEVYIDGEHVGTLPLEGPIRVPPGRHRVKAEAEGYVDAVATVIVQAGDTVPVELLFEPIVTREAGKKLSTPALILWAGGGAVLAGGAILGGLALGKADGAVEGTSAADSARGMALGADIMIGAGAAAVVAGVIVQVVHGKKNRRDSSPDVSFTPTRDGAAFFLRKDF